MMARILGRSDLIATLDEYVTSASSSREKSSSEVHDVALTISFRAPACSSFAHLAVSGRRAKKSDRCSGERGWKCLGGRSWSGNALTPNEFFKTLAIAFVTVK